jgi:CubicO group peptidase (beta-lactamase class C family)/D-alanyl-D-alanine dipeptidase
MRSTVTVLLALVLTAPACAPSVPAPVPAPAERTEYSAVIGELRELIRHEMEAKALPALSIALVDGQEVVWAEGFGHSDPEVGVPATEETVYRVGSVSKLFTDIAIMQLVERGGIDLDAPIQTYLPEFRPESPFEQPVTLRQLMSHRSGLVREPVVGNYFDPTEPSLEATVRSINDQRVVYPPEARIKYSNAGIGVVGYVLERTQGRPFAEYLEEAVLAPLGMERSSFEPRPDLMEDLAVATMWTLHGPTFEAPNFQLGMAPAGSMYSTVIDLAQFLSVLFAGGEGVLERETLEAMWTPQYAEAGATEGFGIGFAISELEGERRIGHGGAIYGFATELAALPDEELGVVVTTTRDIANPVVERIADAALRMMLAAREGRPLPKPETTRPVESALAERLEGWYGQGADRARLLERDGRLFMERGGVRLELRARGDTLVVDDVLSYGLRVLPRGNALLIGGEALPRIERTTPAPAPERWRGLIGEYGWDHNVLYIREEDGRLHALIEWFFDYPLEEVSEGVFHFPDSGLYPGEHLVFTRDAQGRATQVAMEGVVFPRRDIGTEHGETFKITPVRPVDALRREALAASPPRESGTFREPELVELTALDPSIRLDVRYATENNFMGARFYDEPRAFLQRPAAEALVRAHRSLRERGYGLLVHDAYRPWYVTKMFWEATPESQKVFVADPSQGSRHNRGSAVDLTLYDLRTGEPVEMVGGYDEFSDRSYPDYPGGTARQRWHRELLREAMEAQGFDVYEAEWWHFDHRDWREYPILNLTFDRIR